MSLTTHVLDVSCGKPAANILIELWRLHSTNNRTLIGTFTTNENGRVDKPLLETENMEMGTYELVFHVGNHFKNSKEHKGELLFLETVPIRFGVSAKEHYHVPLLIAPGGYSTYRGS
ncbi:hydroxyisourate hydrolase [Anaerobacillus alkalidiazotrophicus]|uniref:5-hydroxyisourate hydrolase n=1 Tax=Anaerobacillus alkalidiazotrophicus TaxID=472963 RepID=A0A1S2MCA1_9BACI|nr:hydroxyisourate hydrolase [Anaerobacillus alkalidiazotrophicus]OIJ22422.1 hydroxyisourate hydrolase [Anaerobacillus alkalidiazotrophicus]